MTSNITGFVNDETASVDALKYQQAQLNKQATDTDELLTLKLRYKEPEGKKSILMKSVVKDGGKAFEQASDDFQFAAAVAAYRKGASPRRRLRSAPLALPDARIAARA